MVSSSMRRYEQDCCSSAFGKWAKNIKQHLIEFSMDGVFYIGNSNNVKLLTQYHGQFSHTDVQNFIGIKMCWT